jgi:hypothetical protein
LLSVLSSSAGGATLIYPEDSDSLRPGKHLQECAINLGDTGRFPVSAIIRWRIWPKVGNQFDRITDNVRAQIEGFLKGNS